MYLLLLLVGTVKAVGSLFIGPQYVFFHKSRVIVLMKTLCRQHRLKKAYNDSLFFVVLDLTETVCVGYLSRAYISCSINCFAVGLLFYDRVVSLMKFVQFFNGC